MVLNISDVDFVIFIVCGCGFGDQYTSILTAYEAYNEFINRGYKVKVCLKKNNLYFPSTISLNVLYDLSPFGFEIDEFEHTEIDKTFKEFVKVESFIVFELYARFSNEFIETYRFTSYVRSHWNYFNNTLKPFKSQFLNETIINLSNKFLENKNEIYGIHFRTPDGSMKCQVDEILNMPYYGGELRRLLTFILNNKEQNFLICSNNQNVINLFEEKCSNVFSNKFLYSLDKHNVLHTHRNQVNDEILVEHAQEIMAEMASFRKCKKIYSVNTFPSNFVSYGIIHNQFHQPWNINLHNIMLNLD